MTPETSATATRPRTYGLFYGRAFVSIMMIAFLVLFTISGAALFVAPPGQMANTLSWTLVGLSKGQWETLHIAFGLLWIPLAVMHLIFNRRVLVGYLRDRVRRTFVWRRELVAALVVTAALGVASVLDLPPVAQLMAWEESFADFWAQRSPNVVVAPGATIRPVGDPLGGPYVPVTGTAGDAVRLGGDPLGSPDAPVAGGGAVMGGGMGRYATVDPETGVAQPVGKEAAARQAAAVQTDSNVSDLDGAAGEAAGPLDENPLPAD
jgi:hypothetical protein